MMPRRLLCLLLFLGACDNTAPTPTSWDGRFESVTGGEFDYFTQLRVGVVDGAAEYAELEAQAVTLINGAELRVDVALESFASSLVADALIEAADNGVEVRVVGDVDLREQTGFLALEAAGIMPIYGDGPLLWQAIFGADLVQREGEDCRMTHNFVLADRRRLLNMSVGFVPETPRQAYFVTVSEKIGKDYGDIFDQLHGEVFATTLTFYHQSVSSDNNRRTYYPTEDGLIEIYFGPQEPLMKEIIDRIYGARQSIHVASSVLLNNEVARALRYKATAGFDVRVVVGTANDTDDPAGTLGTHLNALTDAPGAPIYRVDPSISQTVILVDALADDANLHRPGRGIVLSLPIFAAVPFRVAEVTQDGLKLEARPSDRFSDANMWVVHENEAARGDFTALVDIFTAHFDAGEAP
jgi:sugar-specific transcriptional regulator TrmB